MAEGCGLSWERENCSAAAGESARWRLDANSRNAMRLIVAPTARQSVPTSTWAVATSAALPDQIVAVPEGHLDQNQSQPDQGQTAEGGACRRRHAGQTRGPRRQRPGLRGPGADGPFAGRFDRR